MFSELNLKRACSGFSQGTLNIYAFCSTLSSVALELTRRTLVKAQTLLKEIYSRKPSDERKHVRDPDGEVTVPVSLRQVLVPQLVQPRMEAA